MGLVIVRARRNIGAGWRFYNNEIGIFSIDPKLQILIVGNWDQLVSFTRNLFNSTFKTNPYFDRAIMTDCLFKII